MLGGITLGRWRINDNDDVVVEGEEEEEEEEEEEDRRSFFLRFASILCVCKCVCAVQKLFSVYSVTKYKVQKYFNRG